MVSAETCLCLFSPPPPPPEQQQQHHEGILKSFLKGLLYVLGFAFGMILIAMGKIFYKKMKFARVAADDSAAG
ncbi:hypothetical protein A2U01_0051880, partial [Trifolium medium]|nr:hypothetical protein [Trifolium medium]